MTTTPPKWQAHRAANYDSAMGAQCTALLGEISADANRRRDILKDPRDLHRELFGPFAPASHPEYAGTYRGSPGTTLVGRRSSSDSQFKPDAQYEFVSPDEVTSRMAELLRNTDDLLADQNADDYGKLIALAYTFSWFGKIHPFLDGNGHVQRAIFAVMSAEFGLPLSPRFAIHPRPYDRLLALALETFTLAPKGQENGELGLVAEYLAFFLDGPFNGPRKNLASGSPYA